MTLWTTSARVVATTSAAGARHSRSRAVPRREAAVRIRLGVREAGRKRGCAQNNPAPSSVALERVVEKSRAAGGWRKAAGVLRQLLELGSWWRVQQKEQQKQLEQQEEQKQEQDYL